MTSLRAIKSFHTFLIVDSCFSGSLFATKDIGDAFAAKAGSFPSRWGLAAGMIEKVSDGFHGDNSPFAKAIITFLEKTKLKKSGLRLNSICKKKRQQIMQIKHQSEVRYLKSVI